MRSKVLRLVSLTPLGALASPYSYKHIVVRAGVSPAADSDLPEEWSFKGCYSDSVQDRVLNEPLGFYASNTSMTGEACINYCGGLGYNYAGTGKEFDELLWTKLTQVQNMERNVSVALISRARPHRPRMTAISLAQAIAPNHVEMETEYPFMPVARCL
jgi:hypothetical protein